ncbi:MarR family winged helix-turn-helix transcriptional regulator [Pectinatus haikarae]|uniref:MarR family winged helix-turn-helix transcriptional regulator n=1 Tax=Pectinatus haikarae TaxID=349096 RepID=UPI0018C70D44|nr:MarR family transcriptional regulator [Pectinatus haikarae]
MEDEKQNTTDLIISVNELLPVFTRFIKMYQRSLYKLKPPFIPYQGQIRVLNVIADNDGILFKELMELLDIRSASLSELLNKLEKADLIRREKDIADKRITHVYLSTSGKIIVKNSQNQFNPAELLFGELSSEEKISFYNIIKKLCASCEAQLILSDEFDETRPLPPHLKDHLPGAPLPHIHDHPTLHVNPSCSPHKKNLDGDD